MFHRDLSNSNFIMRSLLRKGSLQSSHSFSNVFKGSDSLIEIFVSLLEKQTDEKRNKMIAQLFTELYLCRFEVSGTCSNKIRTKKAIPLYEYEEKSGLDKLMSKSKGDSLLEQYPGVIVNILKRDVLDRMEGIKVEEYVTDLKVKTTVDDKVAIEDLGYLYITILDWKKIIGHFKDILNDKFFAPDADDLIADSLPLIKARIITLINMVCMKNQQSQSLLQLPKEERDNVLVDTLQRLTSEERTEIFKNFDEFKKPQVKLNGEDRAQLFSTNQETKPTSKVLAEDKELGVRFHV